MLRYRRLCSKEEITQVGITPCSPMSWPFDVHAFAVYGAPQTTQSWVDVFGVTSQRSYAKVTGSHAALAPFGSISSGRFASLRSAPTKLEYDAGSSIVVRDLATGKAALDINKRRPVPWPGTVTGAP